MIIDQYFKEVYEVRSSRIADNHERNRSLWETKLKMSGIILKKAAIKICLISISLILNLKCNMMKTKRQRLWMTIISALCLTAFLGGCKDEKVGIVGVCPVVESTSPVKLATSVPLGTIVKATFNEEMNPATITQVSFTLQGPSPVNGTVSYTGKTASFVPAAPLLRNTTYTGRIKSSVKDLMGNAIQADYVWSFSTGAIVSPIVISTDPAQNATSVPLNKVITATFSVPMDPLTIAATTFTLKEGSTPVAGTVSYSGITASFTPTNPLNVSPVYTATITIGATDKLGIPMANNYVWTFSTQANTNASGVDLKSALRFGILAGVGVSNMAGLSEIHNMDVGISPGVRSSVTGFPPAIIVNGAMYASDDTAPAGVPAMLLQAKLDLTAAYLFAEAASFPAPATVSGDQGGKTLAPGIYKSTSTLLIQSSDLTLDAQGNANAVWIFQIASDLTTVGGAGGNVILSGGAQAKNVFWQIGRSATIGDNTSFQGNVLALTSITMNSNATAVGRMLARNGAVVLTNKNVIKKP